MSTDTLDPRQSRTRAALRAAVLELARESDPTRLSVSAVAAHAGVHRSTFYEHALTPSALLYDALRAELDQVREDKLRNVTPASIGDAVRAATEEVIAHVDRNAEIYSRLEAGAGSSLHAFLGEHFRDSSRLLLREGALQLPSDLGALPRPLAEEAALRFMADGIVGVLAVWVLSPPPRDRESLADTLDRLIPSWWPRVEG